MQGGASDQPPEFLSINKLRDVCINFSKAVKNFLVQPFNQNIR
jgi:hypothetical protein